MREHHRRWYPHPGLYRWTRVHRRSLPRYRWIPRTPDYRDTDTHSGFLWLQWEIRNWWIQWGIHGMRRQSTKKTLEWESEDMWIYRDELSRADRLAIWRIGFLLPGGEYDPRIHEWISRTKNVEKGRKNGRRICGDVDRLNTHTIYIVLYHFYEIVDSFFRSELKYIIWI